jgi:hypothetical protein
MGTHARPRTGIDGTKGRHRGEPQPLIDLDLSATALRTGAVLAAGTTILVAGAGGALAAGAQSTSGGGATPGDFAALRQCESSGNYAIDTGNGFYGAYQFDLGTWHGLGYSGSPNQASPATQDAAAEKLQAERGWEPWPACSAKLGLGTSAPSAATFTDQQAIEPQQPLVVTSAPQPLRQANPPAGATPANVHVAGGVPAFPGTALTSRLVDAQRTDVLIWQARMVKRGWHLKVDGYFGPQSAHVAQQFATEKGITTPRGEVNPAMWTAAWTAPITRS